mmetsp:Transcript_32835/g.75075  ORF Transcript_32835/g.75075 Transcript_32835/m.75075 type:complete len:85 (+) Transcript_32835:310-564(+)
MRNSSVAVMHNSRCEVFWSRFQVRSLVEENAPGCLHGTDFQGVTPEMLASQPTGRGAGRGAGSLDLRAMLLNVGQRLLVVGSNR